jgi:hypothetical protein
MKIALIADSFPPLRTSAAAQIFSLSREFIRNGHELIVIIPSFEIRKAWEIIEIDGVRVLYLQSPKIKDISYVFRTINEFLMPYFMIKNFKKSPFLYQKYQGIIWYSPSIFFGPFVNSLKKASNCKSYLIVRDIFPEWALDLGLMRRGLVYSFFSIIARKQYSVANIIGVQAYGNFSYFSKWANKADRQLEVLNNWLDRPKKIRGSINLSQTKLRGRKIFIYAGNMGVAQGMDCLIHLAETYKSRIDIGFLFVGRGSEMQRLKTYSNSREIDNILFLSEINPNEMSDLYSQCSIGLVALDFRHKSHNIPGKFISYMQNGLPVLANINHGNNLAEIIRKEKVGQVCESNQLIDLVACADILLKRISPQLSLRCLKLFERDFSVERAVRQIEASILN